MNTILDQTSPKSPHFPAGIKRENRDKSLQRKNVEERTGRRAVWACVGSPRSACTLYLSLLASFSKEWREKRWRKKRGEIVGSSFILHHEVSSPLHRSSSSSINPLTLLAATIISESLCESAGLFSSFARQGSWFINSVSIPLICSGLQIFHVQKFMKQQLSLIMYERACCEVLKTKGQIGKKDKLCVRNIKYRR